MTKKLFDIDKENFFDDDKKINFENDKKINFKNDNFFFSMTEEKLSWWQINFLWCDMVGRWLLGAHDLWRSALFWFVNPSLTPSQIPLLDKLYRIESKPFQPRSA